eukprot:5991681-Pyramimonas_sp.AAC.1
MATLQLMDMVMAVDRTRRDCARKGRNSARTRSPLRRKTSEQPNAMGNESGALTIQRLLASGQIVRYCSRVRFTRAFGAARQDRRANAQLQGPNASPPPTRGPQDP